MIIALAESSKVFQPLLNSGIFQAKISLLAWGMQIIVRSLSLAKLIWVQSTTMHLLSNRHVLNVVLASLRGERLLRLMVTSVYGATFLSRVHSWSFQTHDWHRHVWVQLVMFLILLVVFDHCQFGPCVWNSVNGVVWLRSLRSLNAYSSLDTGLVDVSPSSLILIDHMLNVWLSGRSELSGSHDVGKFSSLIFGMLPYWRIAFLVHHMPSIRWPGVLTFGFLQFWATSEATGELFIIFLGDLLFVEELIS